MEKQKNDKVRWEDTAAFAVLVFCVIFTITVGLMLLTGWSLVQYSFDDNMQYRWDNYAIYNAQCIEQISDSDWCRNWALDKAGIP